MQFLSREEILKDLHTNKVDEESKKFFREKDEKSLDYIWARIALGRFIRNTYGLWDPKHPYCELEADPDSPKHADNYSGEIVEQFLKEIGE